MYFGYKQLLACCNRVQLDNVTTIHLTSSDKDDDLIRCRMAANVELEGVGYMRNTSVTEVNC